ncbi:hypothetical protein [Bartonella schoenbuchensis]|uniref:hypothetical protein n=1 Tax=Bartonella schoenbuchensis TaxID=165694 RepID=UPI0031455B3D
MKFEGGCGRWLWEMAGGVGSGFGRALFEGIFKRAYGVGDEVGASGEDRWGMVLRGRWRLG